MKFDEIQVVKRLDELVTENLCLKDDMRKVQELRDENEKKIRNLIHGSILLSSIGARLGQGRESCRKDAVHKATEILNIFKDIQYATD